MSQSLQSTDTVVTYNITGTAANGVDYTVLSGTVTIPAGATSVNIPVAITDDNIVEGSETLVLILTNVTGDPDITLSATAADLTAQTEILDNDTVISITSPGASFSEDAGTVNFCL